jgi:imidazolonepropionase-like amidohydrolase
MKLWTQILTSLFVLIACSSLVGARQGRHDVVFENIRVFDGLNLIPVATVAVDKGIITSVHHGRRTVAASTRIDGADLTLLPGLIDAHVHVSGNRGALRDAIRFGITAAVDLFERLPPRMQALRRALAADASCAQADYFSAGAGATVREGHACCSDGQPTISTPAEAEQFVRDRVAEGSEYIKIIVEHGFEGRPLPTLERPTVKALIDAAHRNGKLAIAHATAPDDVRMVVDAGVDGLAHLWVSSRGKPGDDDELVEMIRVHRVFVIPTLTMVEALTTGNGSVGLLADTKLAPFLTPRARANLQPTRAGSLHDPMEAYFENVGKLYRAGVRIIAGTDAPNAGVDYGISLHRELELLVKAGASPVEALRSATASSAPALRLNGHGAIAPGAQADVVVVKGNPTSDILATRNIVSVWKCGAPIDREPRDGR